MRAWAVSPPQHRRPGPIGSALLCALLLIVAGGLIAPSAAPAQLPGLPPLPNLLPGAPSLPSLSPADWAVDGFKAILKFIFGDKLEELSNSLINLLLAVPLLTDTGEFPRLNAYREYVSAAAWGILGLSFLVSSIRYWLSSFTGAGAHQALMGFARTVAAIALLLMFPIVFDQISRFVNEFTAWLITNPIVGNTLGSGMSKTLTSALSGSGGIAMIAGVASIVMAIVLLLIKVIISALLAVLFVLSPLAIALWPIEELSWPLRNLIQAVLALLAFPVLWAVCFGTFAVLSADNLVGGSFTLGDAILTPLMTLASLIIAFKLPFFVLKQATQAGIAPSLGRGIQSAYYARSLLRR